MDGFNDNVALEAGYNDNDVVNESDGGNAIIGANKLRIYTFDLAVTLVKISPQNFPPTITLEAER